MTVLGRTIVDEQGAMILAESVELEKKDPRESAGNVMERWGVSL
jgi:hypothetical protein